MLKIYHLSTYRLIYRVNTHELTLNGVFGSSSESIASWGVMCKGPDSVKIVLLGVLGEVGIPIKHLEN